MRLTIYNVFGESVKTLYVGKLHIGKHKIAWDGTNDKGDRLLPGIYFCHIKLKNKKISEPILLIE